MNLMLVAFEREQLLYEAGPLQVYRAETKVDRASVIVKLVTDESRDSERAAQLHHEHRVLRSLDVGENVSSIIDFVRDGPLLALVLADIGAASLRDRLSSKSQPLDVLTVVDLAIRFATVLGQLHERDLIHKDINPSNLVWAEQSGRIQVIDFGIASQLSRERQSIIVNEQMAKSLPYISPEQGGRMNRGIDHRTDLYSFGITLYELLTGRLPFVATDHLGWIYAHMTEIAKDPRLYNPTIPEALSAIVLKLMAKNAEDRYQSASGLVLDLKRVQASIANADTLDGFTPGASDVRASFQIPDRLYGREQETELLLECARDAALGKAPYVVVCGSSGIGKSAVIREVQRPVTERRGFFAESKFDQFQRNVPYQAIAQVCEELNRQILARPTREYVELQHAIRKALGANGAALIDLVPSAEKILGPQDPLPQVEPTAARARVTQTLIEFFRAVATASHPVVVFLDDLQWTDSATLAFVSDVIMHSRVPHMAVIGAYRDNEVNPQDPLAVGLEELAAARPLTHIRLDPLKVGEICDLVVDTLQCKRSLAIEVARALHEKTAGNPFFCRELFSTFHREGSVLFSSEQGQWIADLRGIARTEISENVVEFLVEALRQLPSLTQKILQSAACVGNRFDLRTLSIISGRTPFECHDAIWAALVRGLVVPRNDAYKFVYEELDQEAAASVVYKFQHDRVQQAADDLLDTNARARTHLEIGRLLLDRWPEHERTERVVTLTRHFNAASELLSKEEREMALDLNRRSAQRARGCGAHGPALEYLNAACELLPNEPWECCYETTLGLKRDRMDALFLVGQHKEAQAASRELLEHAKTPVERADVYGLLCALLTLAGLHAEAQAQGLRGLAELGVTFSPNPSQQDVATEFEAAMAALDGRDISGLIDTSPCTDPTLSQITALCVKLSSCTYVDGNHALFAATNFRATTLSLSHGFTAATSAVFVAFGLLLVANMRMFDLGYQFARLGTEVEDRGGLSPSSCYTYFVHGAFVAHWHDSLADVEVLFKRAIEAGLQTGDMEMCVYAYSLLIDVHRCVKPLQTAIDLTEKYIDLASAANARNQPSMMRIIRNSWLNLRGTTGSQLSLDSDDLDAVAEAERMTEEEFFPGIAAYHLARLELYFTWGYYTEAFEEVDKINPVGFAAMLRETRFHLYRGLAAARAYPKLSPNKQARAREYLEASLAVLDKASAFSMPNIGAQYHLVRAENARLLGDTRESEHHYDQAIEMAKIRCYPEVVALCHECAGDHYLACGRDMVARVYLQEAMRWYGHWGATAKVQDLVEKHGEALASNKWTAGSWVTTGGPNSGPTAPPTTTQTGSHGDLSTLLKASQALSQEVVLERLLHRLVSIVKENAGAQRVYLVLPSEDSNTWHVEAEGDDASTHVLRHVPLEQCSNLATEVVEYVIRSEREVISGDAAADKQLPPTNYFEAHRVRSLLCMPIIQQGRIVAVLYLENNATKKAFTESRLAVLRLLTGQAAISIANALLYDTLEQKVQSRTAQLERRTDELHSMLRNMQHGIFTIVQDGTIHPEYSAHLEAILERKDIAGKPALSLLFDDSDVPTDARGQCEGTIFMMLGQPQMQFFVNEHVLVTEYTKEMPNRARKKILELSWAPIVEDDCVERLMVVIKDVTELRGLQAESRKQERDLTIVGEILAATPLQYRLFAQEARGILESAGQLLRTTSRGDDASSDVLRRSYHTLKGNARTCGFNFLADAFHLAEKHYRAVLGNPQAPWELDALMKRHCEAANTLTEYERVYRENLASLTDDKNTTAADTLAQLERLFRTIDIADSTAAAGFGRKVGEVLVALNAARAA